MNVVLSDSEIIGKTFGNYCVLKRIEDSRKGRYFLCRCIICGNERGVAYSHIISRTTKRCNCKIFHKNIYEKVNDFVVKVTIDIYNRDRYFIIDSEDLENVKKYKWNISQKGAVIATIKGKNCYIHRYLLGLKNPINIADHINGNQLDNRKCNLRVVSQLENGKNIKIKSNNMLGHSGLERNKTTRNWGASIKVNHKKIWLGTFVTKEDAINARKVAEKKYFGEFGTYESRGSYVTENIDDIIIQIKQGD